MVSWSCNRSDPKPDVFVRLMCVGFCETPDSRLVTGCVSLVGVVRAAVGV